MNSHALKQHTTHPPSYRLHHRERGGGRAMGLEQSRRPLEPPKPWDIPHHPEYMTHTVIRCQFMHHSTSSDHSPHDLTDTLMSIQHYSTYSPHDYYIISCPLTPPSSLYVYKKSPTRPRAVVHLHWPSPRHPPICGSHPVLALLHTGPDEPLGAETHQHVLTPVLPPHPL